MTTPDEARQAGREVAQLLVDALFETGDVGAAIELAQRRLVLRELEPLAIEEAECILREGE